MAKYDSLETYLARQRAKEFELDFIELERIIGSELPVSAARPQWWANETNTDSSHVQRDAWRNAGYDAFLLPGKRVLFKRHTS